MQLDPQAQAIQIECNRYLVAVAAALATLWNKLIAKAAII
jgi:hypothetical protein